MTDLRPKFWETVPLKQMTPAEWEALCDGCGKCCLNKLEFEDTGEVAYTRIACRLLDDATCRCTDYANRRRFVPECVFLTPKTLPKVAYWMPATCAYKLLWQGKSLPDWHPLLDGRSRKHACLGQFGARHDGARTFHPGRGLGRLHHRGDALMFFASDNTSGAAPEIMAALARANEGYQRSYGADALMDRVRDRVREVLEAPEAAVYLVATGTAANALALALVTPPWGAVFCHRHAHVAEDECNAPEFFAGGAKLVLVDGPHGKMTPAALSEQLGRIGAGGVHSLQTGMLTVTNVTEAGTVHTPQAKSPR
jgi:uncharacterized cysteine cluster protein YcgN (CxxCxxCC family)